MRVGMLTSGGDCPGLNAVIRGIVRTQVLARIVEFLGGHLKVLGGFRLAAQHLFELGVLFRLCLIQRLLALGCLCHVLGEALRLLDGAQTAPVQVAARVDVAVLVGHPRASGTQLIAEPALATAVAHAHLERDVRAVAQRVNARRGRHLAPAARREP